MLSAMNQQIGVVDRSRMIDIHCVWVDLLCVCVRICMYLCIYDMSFR